MDQNRLPPDDPERARFLRVVLETTLAAWRGPVEVDLAALFDIDNCALACLVSPHDDLPACAGGGVDCVGVYKMQKGFNGYVASGIQVRRMLPCLVIWRRG